MKAGTTIVFRNRDDIPHSVVGSKGEFHSKALDTDESFSFTFAKAGSYAYSCLKRGNGANWRTTRQSYLVNLG